MEQDEGILTDADTYSVKDVLRMRDNIRKTIRKTSEQSKYIKLEVSDGIWGCDRKVIIDEITPIFAGALLANDEVVHQSLLSLLRDDLVTISAVDTVAWIMAGNYLKLREGSPLEPFVTVTRDEWVPTLVIDRTHCWRFDSYGEAYTFKVFGGSPTTHTLSRFFSSASDRFSISILKRSFGLSRYTSLSYKDVVGLYAWVLIDATKSQQRGKPVITHMTVTPSMGDSNRKLLAKRKKKCPLYPDWTQWDCCNCAHGLVSCGRGTHSIDYESSRCPSCGQLTYHEPGKAECIVCSERRLIRLSKERGSKHAQ